MALSDIFGGLLGGGSDPYDIYGDLFSEKQREALRARQMGEGLLKMAGAFGEAAQPSRLPTSFGAALGKAAGAMAGSGDEAAKTAISGMKVAEDVRASRQKREWTAKLLPILAKLAQSGIDPQSPQGQQIIQQTLANPAPAAPEQPPPATPTDAAVPAGAPAVNAFGLPLPRDLTRYGIPARPGAAAAIDQELPPIPPAPPGGRVTPADYGVPQQQTGLLGAPDQVVGPDGQPLSGPGVLPTMMASYGGAPGGRPPFQLASSPTGGARDDPRGVVPYIRERAAALGIDPDVAERVARSEGVGSFQSNVIQKGGRREPSYGAFQLYTGGGMGNDFQRDTGLDPADPKNEKATIDYALQKARTGGWSPFHGAKGAGISARAGIPGGEDYVIPSGRGVPRSALTNVADTGGAAPGGAAPGGGVIPGLNMTPQQLGALGGMTEILGLDNPFKSLLETYYKSPGYLREAERAKIAEQEPFEQRKKQLDFLLDMRKNGFLIDDKGQVQEDPSYAAATGRRAERSEELKLEYQKKQKSFEEQIKIEEEKRGDQREIKPWPVYQGGVIVEQPMTRAEAVARLKDQSMRPGQYKDGDVVAKPVDNLSPDHRYRMTPQGALSVEPIAGTPAAEKAAQAATTKAMSDRQMIAARDIMNQETDRIEKMMETSTIPVTGLWGSLLSSVPGTPQHNTAVAIQGIEARTSLNAINQMRASMGSSGLGQITMGEHQMLANSIATLKQSQTKEAFLLNLRRVRDEYNNLLSAPGFHGTMPRETTVVPPPKSDVVPEGAVPTGQYHQGKPVYRTKDGKLGTFQ